ncbi:MAG: MerR family transcriptional regulator [Pseudomonadota bacterium]
MPATSAEKRRSSAAARKSSEAFRTISEVAEILDIPAHVLRFWESRFAQVKPIKRGGGRRYYRPQDIDLLRGIQMLLHREGYTIKGVQKILRERGAKYVATLAPVDLAQALAEDGHEPVAEEVIVMDDSPQEPSDARRPRLVVPEPAAPRSEDLQVDLFAHAEKARRAFPPDPARRARADEIRSLIGRLARVRDRMSAAE